MTPRRRAARVFAHHGVEADLGRALELYREAETLGLRDESKVFCLTQAIDRVEHILRAIKGFNQEAESS